MDLTCGMPSLRRHQGRMEMRILSRRDRQCRSPKPWLIKYSCLFRRRYCLVFLCLQIQWSASEVDGGFDSHILPPKSSPARIPRIGGHFIFFLKIPKNPIFIPPVTKRVRSRKTAANPVPVETLRAIVTARNARFPTENSDASMSESWQTPRVHFTRPKYTDIHRGV